MEDDKVISVDGDDNVSMDRRETANVDRERDAKLTEFITMAEGVDVEVAISLLESTNWDLHQALGHIFDLDGRTYGVGPADADVAPEMLTPRSDVSMMGGVLGGRRGGIIGDRMTPRDVIPRMEPQGSDLGGNDLGNESTDDVSRAVMNYQEQMRHHAGCEIVIDDDADMREAIRVAQMAEDRELLQRQEEEYQESLLMDQRKAAQSVSCSAGSQTPAGSDEDISDRQLAEQDRKRQMEERAVDLERKRTRLPAEPLDTDADRIAVLIRLPNGKRLQRNFSKNDQVSTIYDFVDINVGADQGSFDLVSVHPKKCFKDRELTLAEADLCHQTALMLQNHN
eukprot:GEMP01027406.1.p1 GENE.GEMP01027406.1~~GEMP01027406.1.p1  ORF type:complete len:339 (+),score=72.53 GEMP01027406.1:111-1127(+)